jgi:hypothetical protein
MSALPLSRITAVVAVTTVTLAGCATMNVHSFVERGADFRSYRTYEWAPIVQSTGDPRLDNNPFFHDYLRGAIEKRLAVRRIEKTSGAADLRLHYHASVTQKIEISAESTGSYGPEVRPQVYDAGTLVIDLVDTRTNELAWRGWAEGSIEGAIDNQKWMEERIDEAVERILHKLPEG